MARKTMVRIPKETGIAAKIIVFGLVAVIAFAAGVFSSDFFKKDSNEQILTPSFSAQAAVPDNANSGVAVQSTVPAIVPPAVNIETQVQQQPVLAPEHLQHMADMAKRVSEGAKTGDYSYLLGKIDAKEEIPKIDIAEAKYLFDSGKAVFIDARGLAEYDLGHVKGSVSVPTNATPEEIAKLKGKLAGKVLVTYCHGTGCHLADKTAALLYSNGYKKLAIFWGGWPKWNEHKYPVTLKQ